MASASDGFGPKNERTTESRLAGEFVARLAEGDLLDRILEETRLGEGGADEDSADEDSADEDSAEGLRDLKQVAARYSDAAFSLEPVAVELVRAVVGPAYRKLAGSDEAWQAMTRSIAQTLFDDARTRERLERLWHRLCEAQR